MPEVADQPTKPRHTWRPMVLWSAAILLALGLAWFVAAVVVPVWQVHNALHLLASKKLGGRETIGTLGGPAEAAPRLSRYIGTPWADRLPSDLLDTFSATRKGMARMLLGQCGDSAVDHFLGELASADPRTRRLAVQSLRLMGPDAVRAVPQLTEALADPSTDVCCGAAEALGSIGPGAAGATSVLETLLGDDREGVRYTSAWALGKIGSSGAAPVLERLLGDRSRDVRQAAADALGRIRNPGGRIWRDGQAVELSGTVHPSRASAKYYLERSDGVNVQAVHLRGPAVEGLKLAAGSKLRVAGTIEYIHIPEPEGYQGGVELPQTFCYLNVVEVEILGPHGEQQLAPRR